MKDFKYNLTEEQLEKIIKKVFTDMSTDNKKRQFKMFVHGSIEQMEEFIKDFDEIMKKEIKKRYTT